MLCECATGTGKRAELQPVGFFFQHKMKGIQREIPVSLPPSDDRGPPRQIEVVAPNQAEKRRRLNRKTEVEVLENPVEDGNVAILRRPAAAVIGRRPAAVMQRRRRPAAAALEAEQAAAPPAAAPDAEPEAAALEAEPAAAPPAAAHDAEPEAAALAPEAGVAPAAAPDNEAEAAALAPEAGVAPQPPPAPALPRTGCSRCRWGRTGCKVQCRKWAAAGQRGYYFGPNGEVFS